MHTERESSYADSILKSIAHKHTHTHSHTYTHPVGMNKFNKIQDFKISWQDSASFLQTEQFKIKIKKIIIFTMVSKRKKYFKCIDTKKINEQ